MPKKLTTSVNSIGKVKVNKLHLKGAKLGQHKGSDKPNVKINIKAGKPTQKQAKKHVKNLPKLTKKQSVLRRKVIKSQKKNSTLQKIMHFIRDKLQAKVKAAKIKIRKHIKKTKKAMLQNRKSKYDKAVKRLNRYKMAYKKYNTSLFKANLKLNKVKSTILDNLSTIKKLTGKRPARPHAKAHSVLRNQLLNKKIKSRTRKITSLKYRLAKNLVYLKLAKRRHDALNKTMLLHLRNRIHRLRDRISQRDKILMKSIIRRIRLLPNYKKGYKAIAKNVLALKKKHLKFITRKQNRQVKKLQSRIKRLFRIRKTLHKRKNLLKKELDSAKGKKYLFKKIAKIHSTFVKMQPN